MNPRTRARRGDGTLLREELLDAAEQLLVEAGDEDAVSIRAIAGAVGVTPPSFYLHFADKETLVRCVCERQFERLDHVIEEAAFGIDDPIEELETRARAYVRFGLQHPGEYRILFMAKPSEDAEPSRIDRPGHQAFGHMVAAVQRCTDAGVFPADLDASLTSVALWAAVHGITSLRISAPDFPWPDLDAEIGHLCGALLRGLQVPAPESRSRHV